MLREIFPGAPRQQDPKTNSKQAEKRVHRGKHENHHDIDRHRVAMGSELGTPDPNGEDVGQWDLADPAHRITRAAIWKNGVMTPLHNLPGGNNTNAFWINNRGQISGFAENDTFDSTCSMGTPFQVYRFQPVIWGTDGKIQRVLSPLVSKGDTVAYAFTINDHGQVAGNSGLCSTLGLPPASVATSTASHAVLWENDGFVRDLGSLGGEFSNASSINNQGDGTNHQS